MVLGLCQHQCRLHDLGFTTTKKHCNRMEDELMDHFGYNRSQLHKNLVRDAYLKISLLWIFNSIILLPRRRSRRQSSNFLISNQNKSFWWLPLIIMCVVWSRIKRSNTNSYKYMESFLNVKNSKKWSKRNRIHWMKWFKLSNNHRRFKKKSRWSSYRK